jgi:hypothetical protein
MTQMGQPSFLALQGKAMEGAEKNWQTLFQEIV